MKPTVLAIVPARGGSKTIPKKNIKFLNGKPLLSYTAEAALASHLVTKAILSTDDEEIAAVGRECGLDVPFMRPSHLATDLAPTLPVIQHAVAHMEAEEGFHSDIIIILQPTSPLRTAVHIDESLKLLMESSADSIVSVTEAPHSCVPTSIMAFEEGKLVNYLPVDEKDNIRQKKSTYYMRNGAAIYAFTHDCLMEKNSIYGKTILPYFMDKEYSLDIDDMWDWQIAELIIKNKLLE